jgi:hypothetical protein
VQSNDPATMVIGLAIGLAVILLVLTLVLFIGAVILRVAANWAVNQEIPLGSAMVTTLLNGVANFLMGIPVAVLLGASNAGKEGELAARILMMPLSFIVLAALISGRHNMSFGKGAWVAFFMYLISILIGIAVAVIVIAVLFGVSAAMR